MTNAKQTQFVKERTPVMDQLMSQCPFVKGNASGMAVGLPEGREWVTQESWTMTEQLGRWSYRISGTDKNHQRDPGWRFL